MRSFILLLLALCVHAIVFGQVPTNGLIGAWPFSGNANDMSGNLNHGAVVGATLTTDRCGNPNSAYSFNGTSNYIQMLQPGPTGTVSRSVSFWAKTTYTLSGSFSTPVAPFDYGWAQGLGGNAFEVVWNYCAQGVGIDCSVNALIRGNSCINNGAWHHIVAVYDPNISTQIHGIQIYIDAILQPAIVCNISGTAQVVNTTGNSPVTIGKGAGSNQRFFPGSIDDIHLYNRPLTAQEVLQLYNANPCVPPVSGNPNVCAGSANVYSVAPITGATYTWTLPGGWTGASTSNTISTVSSSNSGSISVKAMTGCGGSITYSLAVTSQVAPSLTITSSSLPLCPGATATLTGSGAASYTWMPGGSTNSVITVSPLSATIYSLSGSTNGCTSGLVFNQTVGNNATLTASGLPPLCNGSTATLSASGTASYTWQPGGLTGVTITPSPLITTSYTVTGTSAQGCTASAVVPITVPSALSLNIAASSPTACFGTSITFTATSLGGAGGYTYSWTGGPSTATRMVSSALAGTHVYTVTSTDANACTITATTAVDFFSGLTLNAYSTAICPGAVATLTAGGAGTYTWYPGGLTGSTFTTAPSVASMYTVMATSAQGCTASATRSVIIKPTPSLSFTTAAINCAHLGSATVSAAGTPGPFSFSWAPTAQTGTAASGLFPGTYTVSTYDASSDCVFTPTVHFVPLVPLTGTVSATPSLSCHNVNTATASIALSGGSGSQSYAWTDALGIQTVATAAGLAAGVNTIFVSDLLTFCTVTHTFLVTQPPAMTLNIASSTPSICLGGTISFTATNSGGTPGYSYTWTSGPSLPQWTVNETLAANYSYTVSSTDAHNCFTATTISGKFVSNPTLSVSDVSVCPLQPTNLLASGATSYIWNTSAQTNAIPVTVASTTQYTVTGNTAGCTGSATALVFVKPVPVVNFTSNAPVCQGDSLTMTSSNTHALYSWAGPSGFTSAKASPVLYSVLPARDGPYTLKVTAPNSCTASITKQLTVNPTPYLAASGSTVCEGKALNLTSNFSIGASYLWTGNAFSSTNSNPSLPNAQSAMSGQYTVIITSAAGCTNMATVHASVIPLPVPVIVSADSLCAGATLSLQASGGASYSWFGPNGFNSMQQNPMIQNAGALATGIYSVFVQANTCLASVSKTIVVHALPVITATNTSPLCENSSLSLGSTGSMASYTWTGPSGLTSNVASPFIAITIMANAGIYTLNVTDSHGCEGSARTLVSVLPAPVLATQGATACVGNAATLTASGGSNYSWTGPGGYTSLQQYAYIPVVTTNNTGVYTVLVNGSNACTATATVMLSGSAHPLPAAGIVAPAKACLNSTIRLSASGGVSYNWQGPGNFNSTDKDVALVASSWAATGIYTLTARNADNCIGTATTMITVYNLPQGFLASSKNNVCVPYCAKFSLAQIANVAPVIHSEYHVNGDLIKDTNQVYCFNRAGNYVAEVRFRDTNACVNTSTLLIHVNPRPQADFEYTPLEPLAGIDQVQFYNASKGVGLGGWSWYLFVNDSVTVHEKDPSYLYPNSGKFPVVLVAENIWGCKDTMIKALVVEDEFSMYVPNAFTPNGDGINDLFQPKGQGIAKYNLEIYNRWGQLIFSSNSISNNWDGTYSGKPCKTDTYVWKIVVVSDQNQTRQYTGHVSLLRAAVKSEDPY